METEKVLTLRGDKIRILTLTGNRVIKGVITNVFGVNANDIRGINEPYFNVIRIDKSNNPTERYYCSELESVEEI